MMSIPSFCERLRTELRVAPTEHIVFAIPRWEAENLLATLEKRYTVPASPQTSMEPQNAVQRP